MKKYILFLLLPGILLMSCEKDDFLDRVPKDALSEPGFFKNENDLKLYANRFYTSLPVQQPFNDNNSDNMVPVSRNSFLAGTYVVPTTGGGWTWTNERAVNFFLQRYQRAEASQAVKNQYAAEVKFFRALFYWQKVKQFGDVPWLSTDLTEESPELYGARTPHKTVMDSVLADLNFAVANLPPAQDAAADRLHTEAAQALKSRICLWEGTFRKYHRLGDAEKFLREAATASEAIINGGQYGIYTTGKPEQDYYNLFIQQNLSNNPETILAKVYLQDVLMHNISRQIGENGTGFSKSFANTFLSKDGLPIALSSLYQGDDSPDAEAANRDPRYSQTIATRGFVFTVNSDGTRDVITLPRIGTSVTSTGYQVAKFRSPEAAQINANQSTLDLFIFRYAEVLLNYAEAKAELGEADQAVIDNTINKLRDRVAMPHLTIATLVKDPRSDFPALPALLDEIRRERRVELAAEGFRFDDLLRWKAGDLIEQPESVLGMKLHPDVRAQYPPNQVSSIQLNENGYIRVYPNITTRTWNERMYLYPLPTQELTLNTNFAQNPGW